MFISITSDLQSSINLLRQKERQTLDAARERLDALRRISSDFATLKKNPSDVGAKSRLSGDLETERGYLQIIRDRTKDISTLLDITSGEIKNIRKSNRTNQKITKDLDTLNGILNEFKIMLRFIGGRIASIQWRVKRGDRLLKGKLNDRDRLSLELSEIHNEEMDDRYITGVLRGAPGREPRTNKWQDVKYILALDSTKGGRDLFKVVSDIKPNELPEELKLIAEIIVLIFSFFKIFTTYEFYSEQKEVEIVGVDGKKRVITISKF